MNRLVTVLLLIVMVQQIKGAQLLHISKKKVLHKLKFFSRHKTIVKNYQKKSSFKKANQRNPIISHTIILPDDIINLLFSPTYLFPILPSSYEGIKTLKSICCISKKINAFVSSPQFTISVINKMSNFERQFEMATKIGTASACNYCNVNDRIYRTITQDSFSTEELSSDFFDPNYFPKTRQRRRPIAFRSVKLPIIKMMIKKGTNVNVTHNGITILQNCVIERCNESIDAILKEGNPEKKCIIQALKSKREIIINRILPEIISEQELDEAFRYFLARKSINSLEYLLKIKMIDPSPYIADTIAMLIENISNQPNKAMRVARIIEILCQHKAWNEQAYQLSQGLPTEFSYIKNLLKNNVPSPYNTSII